MVARPVDTSKREVLLERTAVYLSANGLTDTSLRDVAAALGTTTRMLVYYFGTKESLFSAVLDRHRQDFRAVFDDVDTADALIAALESLVREMAGGEKEPAARLLIQMLGAGASRGSEYRDHARAAIEEMTTALRDVLVRIGVADAAASAHARVIGAAFRGMLIDRFTASDGIAVDATADDMFAMLVDLATGGR